MEQDGKKELSRREFLAWAAAVAAMVVLPGAGGDSLCAAADPAAPGYRAAVLASANASVSSTPANNFRTVAPTQYDPFGPIVVPDPPPSVVIDRGVVGQHASASSSAGYQTASASYQTTTTYAAPNYQQTSYQTSAYQNPVYQPAAVQPVAYAPAPATLSSTTTVASYAAPAAYAAPAVYTPPPQPQAARPAGGKLSAVSRGSWSAIPPNPQKMRGMKSVNRITIHHEGSAKPNNDTTPNQVAATLRLIQGQHRKRMGAGDIGYHFIIDRTGRIWQGRDWAYQGAHTAGANSNNLGVMLLGNFDIQSPTQPQLQSLHTLVRYLARMHGVPGSRIFGHSDFCNTQCPGKHLKPQVQYLRNSL